MARQAVIAAGQDIDVAAPCLVFGQGDDFTPVLQQDMSRGQGDIADIVLTHRVDDRPSRQGDRLGRVKDEVTALGLGRLDAQGNRVDEDGATGPGLRPDLEFSKGLDMIMRAEFDETAFAGPVRGGTDDGATIQNRGITCEDDDRSALTGPFALGTDPSPGAQFDPVRIADVDAPPAGPVPGPHARIGPEGDPAIAFDIDTALAAIDDLTGRDHAIDPDLPSGPQPYMVAGVDPAIDIDIARAERRGATDDPTDMGPADAPAVEHAVNKTLAGRGHRNGPAPHDALWPDDKALRIGHVQVATDRAALHRLNHAVDLALAAIDDVDRSRSALRNMHVYRLTGTDVERRKGIDAMPLADGLRRDVGGRTATGNIGLGATIRGHLGQNRAQAGRGEKNSSQGPPKGSKKDFGPASRQEKMSRLSHKLLTSINSLSYRHAANRTGNGQLGLWPQTVKMENFSRLFLSFGADVPKLVYGTFQHDPL